MGTPLYKMPIIVYMIVKLMFTLFLWFYILLFLAKYILLISSYSWIEKPFKKWRRKKRLSDEEFWPELNDDVQKSLRSLIERCWFGDTDENPIFEEIYKKIAFDKNYFLDNHSKFSKPKMKKLNIFLLALIINIIYSLFGFWTILKPKKILKRSMLFIHSKINFLRLLRKSKYKYFNIKKGRTAKSFWSK